jgi:hypothetical protein
MPTEKTITLYTFEELDERAKEKARDWWRGCMDESDFSHVIDDFQAIAEKLGITLKTHEVKTIGGKIRHDPNVFYSLAYCQGDFAAFEGVYSYQKGAAALVKAYAPQDEALQGIADRLQAIQRANFYQLRSRVTYDSYYGLQVETERDGAGWNEATDSEVKEIMRDLAAWLYNQLDKENQHLTSDESIAEALAANEYTFRGDGTRED